MIFGSSYSTHVKKRYILEAINTLFIRVRKPTYTNEYLLDSILECNLNYQSWAKYGRTLRKFTKLPKFHNKYLNEIYLRWSSLGIFELAYKNLINDNLDYNQYNLKLNTDVTCISNMYGVEKIGINPEYTKKHVTKLATLNTLGNAPIGATIVDNKKILKTHNTLCHDKTSIQPLLNNILVVTNNAGNIKINGDKAYITSDKYSYKDKNITIITPTRKKTIKQAKKEIKTTMDNIGTNELKIYKYKSKYGDKSKNVTRCFQKIENMRLKIKNLNKYIDKCNDENKIKTTTGSKRYLIENYFCALKHIPKLYLRTDKLIKTFMSTVYIGFIYNYKITH